MLNGFSMNNDFDYVLLCMSFSILIFWGGYFGIHLLAICYGKYKLYRKISIDTEKTVLPPVSIIKPLVGIDSNLFSNLETFFTLKYPQYEILFCIETESDPVLMLVKSLVAKYPQVDSRIFIGGQCVGVNPKINNMMPGYTASKYDLVMISDSGMRMKEDTLLDMVAAMTYKVGIVTQMPFTCDRTGFCATVEKVYFGTAHARIYLTADFLNFICSTGMSSMLRKKVLEELGGMRAFGCYLAEDYYFASSIASKGWKCAISSQPGWQNSGHCYIGAFHDRVARWAKLRLALVPFTSVLEPFQECILLGLMSSWAVNVAFGWNSLIFLLIHILVWMLSDYVLLSIVQNGPLPFSKYEFFVSWLYREMTALPVFLRAVFNPTVRWRNRSYRLKWGSVAEEVKRPQHFAFDT